MADCRKIATALIPISMIRIERIEDIKKKHFIFVQQHFLSPIYFDGIS